MNNMKKNNYKNFCYFIGIIFIIIFTSAFLIDEYKTKNHEEDYIQFTYNIFNEPYKYIIFKTINEKEKNFVWVSKNQEDPKEKTIYLLEMIYLNSKTYYTQIDKKEINFD